MTGTRTGSAFFVGTFALGLGLALAAGCDTAPVDAQPPATPMTGCAEQPTQPVAPGGYYVNGNTVCTFDGRPHLLHGVDRPSLEWSSAGQDLSLSDFRLMGSWNANVVRIALNQDFWIAESPLYDPSYPGLVDSAIRWAEMSGMDVILDLHWSDKGVLGGCAPSGGCQQRMADVNSLTFWSQLAARYQNDGRVMFELYNEPHNISWRIWRSGGETSDGFQAVGMQQLYEAVRSTGAQNLVIIGGLDWGYDLSEVPANRIAGHNIVYSTHPYNNSPERLPGRWDHTWGFLTSSDPVIVTEFGDTSAGCSTDFSEQLVEYANAHAAGWTAWGWFPGGCAFPGLIDDWTGTPSPSGTVIKDALLGYDDPPASPPTPGGSDNRIVSYTFDKSTEGWRLSDYVNTTLTNLGAAASSGSAASLVFSGSDGDPSAGSLLLTAAFTGFDQSVVAVVGVPPPGLDLSRKTLNARIRLLSGSLLAGNVQLLARTGTSYVEAVGPSLDIATLPVGTWVPVVLDLGSATVANFDPSQVVHIAVRFSSGPASNAGGAAFQGTGDTVFEIDTVTD